MHLIYMRNRKRGDLLCTGSMGTMGEEGVAEKMCSSMKSVKNGMHHQSQNPWKNTLEYHDLKNSKSQSNIFISIKKHPHHLE